MENDLKSNIIAYANGDLLDTKKVSDALCTYWGFTDAEKRAFDRIFSRADLKQKYLVSLNSTEP